MKSPLYSSLVPAGVMLASMVASCGSGEGVKQSLSPTYACDSAVVNITVVDYDSARNGYIDAIMSFFDDLGELAPQQLDAEGKTSVRLDLQGDVVMTLFDTSGDARYGVIRVAPGEVTDVTIYPDSIVTTGRFADFNRIFNSYEPKYGMDIFGADFFRYDMNGDDYTAAILAEYTGKSAAIDADGGLTDAERVIERSALTNALLSLASNRVFAGRCNYLSVHPDNAAGVPMDSIATDMSDANYAAVLAAIDPNDDVLLMDGSIATSLGDVDWNAVGASGTLLGTLSAYQKAAKKAYEGKVDAETMAELQAYGNPFFAQAVDNIRGISEKRFEEASKLVSPTPDVDGKDIIDAIAAKYPGKVVLIDRWNTWCGPCKAGIAENEPLKQTTLSDPDIVWVYVADESSPIPTYYKMIPDIKGEHYRLTREQAEAMYSRYNIDGIPYYFLVDRDGVVTPRPDFRDHDLLVKTILEKL